MYYCTGQNSRQNVSGSCSRALEAIRSVRQRLSGDTLNEQKANFAPYSKEGNSAKPKAWSAKFVCLSNKEANRVPCNKYDRNLLVQAGLGDKKFTIPNIDCTPEEFNAVIVSAFPKLGGCGGFELLRCLPNTKDLEVISLSIAQSPKLLKSVIGGGRIFIRPIQKSLDMTPAKEVSSIEVRKFVIELMDIMC